MQRPSLWRTVTALLVGILVLTALPAIPASYAQDGGEDDRLLEVGQAVTGTLDTENFAQTYIFRASAGDTATLTATTDNDELALALMLTGPQGQVIERDGDTTSPTVATLSNVELPDDGTYVVTVLRGTGAEGDAAGEFTLALTGSINAPPAASTGTTAPTSSGSGQAVFISLDEGPVDFELTWNAAVDFNLEVRDPVGGAVYWENAQVSSGGQHGGNTNQECAEATADSPTEAATWPGDSVPTGSYEVLIYYQDGCDVGGPQSFTLGAAVNGDDPETITGVLNPGQIYLARLELARDTSWTLFNGGVNAGLDVSLVDDVQPVALGDTATGTLTNDNVADAYAFEGVAGETVTVAMDATSGSLDTLLILLNDSGQRVADNDDRQDGTTNSRIEFTLPNDGEYTIIATRYGQTIGGTEGDYTLSINQPAQVADTGDDTTPPGDDDTGTVVDTAGLPTGSIEVRLDWATDADLQLLVRDPRGDSVFDDAPTITSGGILEAVGNQNCVAADGNPISYVYWPQGRTPPRGTYEVEVWYQGDCDDTRTVDFTLSVEVNGEVVFDTSQTPTLGSKFMVNFTVNPDNTVSVGETGFFLMNDVRDSFDIASAASSAQPIEYDTVAQGTITQDEKFRVYSFEGRSGDRISVSMQQTSGNLDTAVYVLGPAPSYIQLSFSDDIEPGENTNSRIGSVQLQSDGTYYIVATHYGLRYGGTEGNYTLNLTLLP